MGSHQSIRKVVTPEIPDKLYFRIGDVARLCEVPAYVLRFWETEFPQLKPNKGGTGQRLYRKRDVEMALRIKSLLYDQGYTIPGARQVFKSEARVKDTSPAVAEESVATPRVFAERSSSAAPATENGATAPRRDELLALREQLGALLSTLSAPVGAVPLPAMPPSPAARSSKLQMLRPRLVAEPATPAAAKATPRPSLRPGLLSRPQQEGSPRANQADLFSSPATPSE